MKLDELLKRDREAKALFHNLPLPVQKSIHRSAGDIDSLAALREYTIRMVDHDGPFFANGVIDGTNLDMEYKAEWTREHQT